LIIGKYTTKDGQIYDGEWDGDKLVDNQDVFISYADGATYTGTLLHNKYSGRCIVWEVIDTKL